MATRVVCLRRRDGRVVQDCDVYIGRPMYRGGWALPKSRWHNPFTVASCGGDAAEAVRRYEQWIRTQPRLLERVWELRGKTLGCWCKKTGNEPCHGDVLVRLVERLDGSSLEALCTETPANTNEHPGSALPVRTGKRLRSDE